MKCGICGSNKRHGENYTGSSLNNAMVDHYQLRGHKQELHAQELRDQRMRSQSTREANTLNRLQQDSVARAARVEGRETVAMPVVTRKNFSAVTYEVGITSDLAWYLRNGGQLWIPGGDHRLLDLGPQAAYTAIQNQIDRLQADQQTLLAVAFETGPEVSQEHLEAVQAAGERAVERLNAEQ